jgi:hypothetical protein
MWSPGVTLVSSMWICAGDNGGLARLSCRLLLVIRCLILIGALNGASSVSHADSEFKKKNINGK